MLCYRKKGPAIDVLFPRYVCEPYKCSWENVYLHICQPCLFCEIGLTKRDLFWPIEMRAEFGSMKSWLQFSTATISIS